MVGTLKGAEGDFDMATMKKFVSYCRLRCAPRLSPEAGQTLASEVRALGRALSVRGGPDPTS